MSAAALDRRETRWSPATRSVPPASEAPRPLTSGPTIESEADRLLLGHFAPAAALITEGGDIVYCSGYTGRFLEPAAGKANWNVLAMAREGLLHPLGHAIALVRRDRGIHVVRGVTVQGESRARVVDVTVQAVDEPRPLQGMLLIVFSECSRPMRRLRVLQGDAGLGGRRRERRPEPRRRPQPRRWR